MLYRHVRDADLDGIHTLSDSSYPIIATDSRNPERDGLVERTSHTVEVTAATLYSKKKAALEAAIHEAIIVLDITICH